MQRWLGLLVGGWLLVLAPALISAAEEMPPKLTDTEKQLFDELLRDTIVDPRGCQRASIKTTVRSMFEAPQTVRVHGWLRTDPTTKAQKFFWNDGRTTVVKPEHELQTHDFVAWYKQRNTPQPGKKETERDIAFVKMNQAGAGLVDDLQLALAVWLYRLGEESLAAQALQTVKQDARYHQNFGESANVTAFQDATPTGIAGFHDATRSCYAWSLYAKMVHAYKDREDEEALTAGELLLARFPDQLKWEDEADQRPIYSQAPAIVADLRRRIAKGTLGKKPPTELPAAGAKWTKAQQAAFWIEQLDEVDTRQSTFPFAPDIEHDPRVQALIKLGDEVVPQLIDVLEKDHRLTRSVYYWQDFEPVFDPRRTVSPVSDAASFVLGRRLRVQLKEFAPLKVYLPGESRNYGEMQAPEKAAILRQYWAKYGNMPFAERMMSVLTDPATSIAAKREAATNLVNYPDDGDPASMAWGGYFVQRGNTPNPVVAKFSNPTVAEAVLAFWTNSIPQFKPEPPSLTLRQVEEDRNKLEDFTHQVLTTLNDRRITPTLAKMAREASTTDQRKKWAYRAHILGDSEPAREFIRDFRANKLNLKQLTFKKSNREDPTASERRQLAVVVEFLVSIKLPEAEAVLREMSDPKHRYAALIEQAILDESWGWNHNEKWLRHPFCVPILRRMLENPTPINVKLTIRDSNKPEWTNLIWTSDKSDGGFAAGPPPLIKDPQSRIDATNLRACDQAAEALSKILCFSPAYHPLLKNADLRLLEIKRESSRFNNNFRVATRFELGLMRHHIGLDDMGLVPNIQLDHPATAADVTAGKAIFHLADRGKLAKLTLPAAAKLLKDKDNFEAPFYLILQAEVDEAGKTILGVVTRGECTQRPASDFGPIRSLAELEKESHENLNNRSMP